MLGDLGKLLAAKGFKKLPKVQKIARSGHTVRYVQSWSIAYLITIRSATTCAGQDTA